jgi:hypothetical protein
MSQYSRQVRLAEIGATGQEKLGRGDVAVPRGFAGWVARRYLEAGGVGRVREGDFDARDARFDDLDPAARDVALGAHHAAVAMMEIVSKR